MTSFEESLSEGQLVEFRKLRADIPKADGVEIEIFKNGAYRYYEAGWLRDALGRLCSEETAR